ncbi:hypothetical protein MSG28_016232 [Choristoneura fumiferana]|uniref:Uncharacterized protein n=1 Tax=Choristoneura fumiferana TaxID=7141 RepID=A0ACC0K5Z9_CHOFU|nr:hypothetical protein MSG28_016232 [Choristoneura fumiferana]
MRPHHKLVPPPVTPALQFFLLLGAHDAPERAATLSIIPDPDGTFCFYCLPGFDGYAFRCWTRSKAFRNMALLPIERVLSGVFERYTFFTVELRVPSPEGTNAFVRLYISSLLLSA